MNRIRLFIILAVGGFLLCGFIRSPNHSFPKNASLTAFNKSQRSLSLKYIYLTFDDGPLSGSEHIDSVIRAERLKNRNF